MKLMRAAALTVAGAALIALGAHIDAPMHPVPMSLQSLAIVLIAAFAGPIVGVLSVALYLLAGALGAPVFAGGEAGAAHLVGPTAGYLWGFLIAAGVVGALVRGGWGASMIAASAAMLIGHAILLGLGVARLALLMPLQDAIAAGATPFLLGALVKSVLAAVIFRIARNKNGRAPKDAAVL